MDEKKMNLLEFKLSSGRIVHLRDMSVDDQEMAVQAAAPKITAETHEMIAGMLVQKELLKNILVAIDRKKLSAIDKESVNQLWESYSEYQEVLSVIKDMMGNPTKPVVKMVSSIGSN